MSLNNSSGQVWAQLFPFTPEVPLAGSVRAVGRQDPRTTSAGLVDFDLSLNGVRLPGWCSGVPWVWYRRPTPVLTADDFDAAVSYTVAPNPTF